MILLMRAIFFIITILLSNSFVHSQTISGYIINSETGEKIIGANIYCKQNRKGTISNEYGFYSLTFNKAGNYGLQVSFVGCETINRNLYLTNDTTVNFELASQLLIDEVKVTGTRPVEERTEMSVVEIPINQLKKIPMLAGETDIIKAMHLMPGVRSGSEGQSSMFVRGGSHDQNLILLDEVPLYNINHLGGFVSVFNTEAINSVKMYKGGFPARYGGRLSSITDVRMKDGSLKKRHTNISIGIISSKFQTEGPVKKDTASYMISTRRFMYDLFSRPYTWLFNDKLSSGYTFYDYNAKLNYRISPKDRLFFSLYVGNDRLMSKMTDKTKSSKDEMLTNTKWGNRLLALRWNHVFNNRLFGNITTNYTKYIYNTKFSFIEKEPDKTTESSFNFISSIADYSLKSGFEYYASEFVMRFGGHHIYHRFTPSITSIVQTGLQDADNTNEQKYSTFENTVYLENDFDLFGYLKFNIGARAVAYSTQGKTYYSAEPRMLLNLNIPGLFSLRGSYCVMQQYVHLLTYSGAGLPADLWMPVTNKVPPQTSNQLAVGIAKSFLNNSLEFSIEAYHKKMSNLIDYKEDATLFDVHRIDWHELVETNGKGWSEGIELLVQKKDGKLNGWIGYTLSITTRQFENINRGEAYPFTYDATHDFSITSNYYIDDNLFVSFSWVYTTGRAITYPNELYHTIRLNTYNRDGEFLSVPQTEIYTVEAYYDKNSIRMQAYHRLDVGLSLKVQKKKSERIWNIGVYNAYNRKNAYYYYTAPKTTETGEQIMQTYKRSLFPFIPSVSYTIDF